MVEASFQRMARSPIAQVLHKFSQAPGTPIKSKPSHSHELFATNHKVIYIKTNNVTHSERMTSHHYHKFTVIEETSNFFLHAYDEMVSIRENWRTNSAANFHRCKPFCCNKIYPGTSENVAYDIFQPLAWDNHATSTSRSESLKAFAWGLIATHGTIVVVAAYRTGILPRPVRSKSRPTFVEESAFNFRHCNSYWGNGLWVRRGIPCPRANLFFHILPVTLKETAFYNVNC